ncbi:MAG: PEGA domain-containing protein, partial [Ignavibacteria bacterium]|nr:PEGA domain-containing protein [Ignavibacteria bacterium]
QTAEEMYAYIESFESEISAEKKKGRSPVKSNAASEKTSSKPGFKIDFKNPVMLISSLAALVILVTLFVVYSSVGGADNEAYLSISTTPPGAEIIINDKSIGKSPTEEFKIESDVNITLKISKDGFISLDTSLNIKSGEKENLVFKLSPVQKEQIKIVTNPAGAKLIINNNFAGNSPLDNFSIRRGENNIRIEKVGYLLLDTLIRVEKDLAKTFNITLSKDPEFKGFGTLKIISKPVGASVLLNGELVGKTPYENKEQPVADYQLVIRQSGYTDYNETVKIIVNKTITVSKQLAAASITTGNEFGKIKVTTKPSEAAVYLNGEFVGSTPYENDKTPVGSHNLLIKKKGYGEISETVTISLDKLTPVSKDLVAAGKLTVTSEPTGADVIINDKTVGKTPYTSSNLAIGDYTITITKSGFKPYTEKIKIEDIKSAPKISQKLEPLTGKVEILVRPYGSIYVNNELKAQDSNSPYVTELPGGKHKIRLVHPTLGKTEKEIIVIGEKLQKYIFDLSRVVKLTIVSNPPNCEIFINGESIGKNTPTQQKLGVGSYKIMVKREGYDPSKEEKYDVSSSIYEESEDKEDRREFILTKIQ